VSLGWMAPAPNRSTAQLSSDHNSSGETEFAADVAAEICGPDSVIRNVAPSMGGEDFSFMVNARPGAMLWLGNGPGEDGCFLHRARNEFNDAALPIGASFWRDWRSDFLSCPHRGPR
jgi:metal-dependent amidase/aminoacylase/carboxypeptidase family protein